MTTTSGASWRPAASGFAFSDYGEWLDEGTTQLLDDVKTRAEAGGTPGPGGPARVSDVAFSVVHDASLQEYGAWLDGREIANLTYKLVGNRVALWSTAVLPDFRGHGVATDLITQVLDDIRANGRTVTVVCPIVREVIERYPRYRDLLDPTHPGVQRKAQVSGRIEAEAAAREENNAALIAALDQPSHGDVHNDVHSDHDVHNAVHDEVESRWVLDVVNDVERGRWFAALGAEAIAELSYRFVGGRVVLLTTWVDPAYRGGRVATELIAHVLDEIRESGKKITIICPVVGEFIARHPEYLDLIDKVHPGSGAYPKHEPAGGGHDEDVTAWERDLT